MNQISEQDPVQEVREARKRITRHFHSDLQAIVADAREREQKHPERLATIPPSTPTKK
jgi:hypothetical protein